MLKTERPRPGLLFASFLFRSDLYQTDLLRKFWEERIGPSLFFIPQHNPLANYYEKEMGNPLDRFFVLSQDKFPREFLLSTKLQAIQWESDWALEEKRTVNVDIGFLSLENFILATTKNYSHRVFLGHNIFADLTYQFQQGEWAMFPWTYPDYQDDEKLKFFLEGRKLLLKRQD